MGIHEQDGHFHLIIVFLYLHRSTYLHVFMHQGEMEMYQGARPCLCGLCRCHILKEELVFEATGPGSDGEVWARGRDGRRFDVQK